MSQYFRLSPLTGFPVQAYLPSSFVYQPLPLLVFGKFVAFLSSALDKAGVCQLTPGQLAAGFLHKLSMEIITIAAPH